MNTPKKLHLSADQTHVELFPDQGGSLAAFYSLTSRGRRDWLHPRGPRYPAAFVVVPWCSRIKNGRFAYRGRTVQLATDVEPHPIHGHGWRGAWHVQQANARQAVLHFEHSADTWPWSYRVEQHYILRATQLSLGIEVVNLSATPMPVAAGLHPFFTRTPKARLRAEVTSMWVMEEGFPTVPLTSDGGLAQGIEVDKVELDHVFSDLSGPVEIQWPEWQAALTMESSKNLSALVVWSPSNQPFFCAEPLSGLPHLGGFKDLGPGQNIVYEICLKLHTRDVNCQVKPSG